MTKHQTHKQVFNSVRITQSSLSVFTVIIYYKDRGLTSNGPKNHKNWIPNVSFANTVYQKPNVYSTNMLMSQDVLW